MTATKPPTVTVDHVWKGPESGIGIIANRGLALTYINDMNPGQLQQAIDLANEVKDLLFEAGQDISGYIEHSTLHGKGWWYSVHLRGPRIGFDVNTFAAWLLVQENLPMNIHVSIYGDHEWVIHSPVVCTEDHKHSQRHIGAGLVVCVPVHVTAAALRKMERDGAFETALHAIG